MAWVSTGMHRVVRQVTIREIGMKFENSRMKLKKPESAVQPVQPVQPPRKLSGRFLDIFDSWDLAAIISISRGQIDSTAQVVPTPTTRQCVAAMPRSGWATPQLVVGQLSKYGTDCMINSHSLDFSVHFHVFEWAQVEALCINSSTLAIFRLDERLAGVSCPRSQKRIAGIAICICQIQILLSQILLELHTFSTFSYDQNVSETKRATITQQKRICHRALQVQKNRFFPTSEVSKMALAIAAMRHRTILKRPLLFKASESGWNSIYGKRTPCHCFKAVLIHICDPLVAIQWNDPSLASTALSVGQCQGSE